MLKNCMPGLAFIRCSNQNCPTGQRRTGSCSGTSNGYKCDLIPNAACETNQWRSGSNPGICKACNNSTCGSQQYRQGSCSGTIDGFT